VVKFLGKKDGYLSNDAVRIPMPESLKTVDSGLRRIGHGKVADSFIETMHRAVQKQFLLQ